MVVTGKHIQDNKTKPDSYRKMCSNISLTSSGGGVGGGGCGGGYNGGYGCESIYSKKPKRQRVPKRGPGVAELEKILREQEKKPDLDKAKNEGFSLVSSPPCSYQPQSNLLPSPHSLPKPVASLAPIPNHFTPTTTAFYTNNSDSNPPLGGGRSGVQLVGSGLILPEHALLPTMWSSCEPNAEVSGDSGSASGLPFSTHLSNRSNNHLFPSTFMQRSQHSPPLMKDLFPHPVVSSSTISSPAGPCHGREPPSNQTCHHYTSLWPEEDKMVGSKRSRPFSMEMIPPVPPFRFQAPTFSAQMSRLDSSLSCGSHSMINLEPCDTISREIKPGNYLEPSIKKCTSTETGTTDGNFLLLGSSTTPSVQNQREGPKFSFFPFQESNGESQCRGGSVQKKIFSSFLVPRKQMGMLETNLNFGLNNERAETRGDGIDLNLKL